MILHDTHLHLDLMKNRKKIVEEITKKNVYSIAVTNLPTVFNRDKQIIPETKYLKHALGYHPELISDYPDLLSVFKKELKNTRYIGEIGLDASQRNRQSLEKQKAIFSSIVSSCHEVGGKILTVHSRKAEKEVFGILGDKFNGQVILHWYMGSMKNLEIAIDRGYWFSINPQMISSKNGRMIIDKIPIERFLIETDSPFGINEQELDYISIFRNIITAISEIKSENTLFIEEQLDRNFRKLINS
ncbi:Qat anti-phage system TatD family nuclease QatD [Enterococcus casseliflavus]|uniref:Qat anti-phage system TatD family nuclease QatD n=1 Tax=Enterococcus casseliflavus TaxID=37734 RepID=UPI003D115EB9